MSLFVPAPFVGGAFDPDANALFARMSSQPDGARKKLISGTIVALKAAGIWSKLDALYLFAAHDSQAALLNWISTSYNATSLSSPTFTTDRGFTGNGSNAYINSNFNPSAASTPNFVQNSAHVSLWSRTPGGSSQPDLGSVAGDTSIYCRNTLAQARYQVNDTASTTLSNSDGSGHFLAVRPNSSNKILYRNGGSLGSTSQASSAVENSSIYFLRRASSYSSRELAAGSIGASLDGTEATAFYNAIQAYMTAVGA